MLFKKSSEKYPSSENDMHKRNNSHSSSFHFCLSYKKHLKDIHAADSATSLHQGLLLKGLRKAKVNSFQRHLLIPLVYLTYPLEKITNYESLRKI